MFASISNIYFKFIEYILSPFGLKDDAVNEITQDMYLWNNKPIKPKSVLLWDLENIPFNRLDDIKKLAKYTPEELYIITLHPLADKTRAKIQREQFKILDAHKTISDDKIISIMKLYNTRPDMILISSDSDFVREAKRYLKNGKLHWIVTDAAKKAIIMRVDISNINLTISTLLRKKKLSNTPKHRLKRTPNKISEAKINSEYGIYQNILYIKGVLKRSYSSFISILKYEKPKKKSKFIFKSRAKKPYSIFDYLRYKKSVLRRIYKDFINSWNTTSGGSWKILTILKKQSQEQKQTQQISKTVYRVNDKTLTVQCGTIYINSNGNKKLKLSKKLRSKLVTPIFSDIIKFNQYSEVSNLIHYNNNKCEYYLNEFLRRDVC